jgi:hypothetical protein
MSYQGLVELMGPNATKCPSIEEMEILCPGNGEDISRRLQSMLDAVTEAHYAVFCWIRNRNTNVFAVGADHYLLVVMAPVELQRPLVWNNFLPNSNREPYGMIEGLSRLAVDIENVASYQFDVRTLTALAIIFRPDLTSNRIDTQRVYVSSDDSNSPKYSVKPTVMVSVDKIVVDTMLWFGLPALQAPRTLKALAVGLSSSVITADLISDFTNGMRVMSLNKVDRAVCHYDNELTSGMIGGYMSYLHGIPGITGFEYEYRLGKLVFNVHYRVKCDRSGRSSVSSSGSGSSSSGSHGRGNTRRRGKGMGRGKQPNDGGDSLN